jgi:hypothetical protein
MLTVTVFTSNWRLGWLIKSRQLEGNITAGSSEGWRPYSHGTLSVASLYWGADKSLAPPGRKQATATEDFEFHISYL